MKLYIQRAVGLACFMSLAACGSAATSAAGATAATDDVATGSVTASVVGTDIALQSANLNQSESVKKSVAKAVKDYALGKVATSVDVAFSETENCSTSGTIAVTATGAATAEVNPTTQALTSLSFDVTTSLTFAACVETATIVASDDATCTVGTTLDGGLSCPMTGSFDQSAGTVSFNFACSTTSACTGLTVTIGGTAHTVGTSLAIAVSGTESTLSSSSGSVTGTLCIDGDTFNIEDLEDASATHTAAELGCQ